QLFLVVVIVVTTVARGHQVLIGHRWGADLVLEQRDQVANDSIVESERALELRQRCRIDGETGDNVIPGLAGSDRVGELAATPMVDFDLAFRMQQSVQAGELLGYGGVFERGIEDVDRLVFTWHGEPPCGLMSRPPWARDRGRRVSFRNA